jgi:glyoxylase-like metal-dependent hydrolase (beta-lactamase superfamily II)
VQEVLPGVVHWTAVHPNIGIEVSSYWLEHGGVLIDPLVPPDAGLEWFAGRSTPPQTIVLSNRHHYRESERFLRRFDCGPVRVPRSGLHEFGERPPVEPYDPGDTLSSGLYVFEIGALCPDDMALHLPSQRALFFADGLVRGHAGGPLGFVPDSLMDDPEQTKQGLLASLRRALEELAFDHVLLAHGGPVIGDGRRQLEELVDSGGRTAFDL